MLVQGIWEIYNECPVRQGRRFPHYGRNIDEVRRMSATFMETSTFIGAYFLEKLIGFMKLTRDDEIVAGSDHAHYLDAPA